MTKICTRCSQTKDLEDFAWKIKAKGTRSSWCKACHRESYKKRYDEDPKEKQRLLRNGQKRKQENRAKIIEYLRAHPCIDCGEPDPVVLEFDHKEMIGAKGRRISYYYSYPWKRILEELEKCDVRCANCHTRRTARQMGSYRLEM